MQRPILIAALVLGISGAAQAQAVELSRLLLNTAQLSTAKGDFNGMKGHEQKSTAYVLPASYRGQTFLQKRTPPNKLTGKKHLPAVQIEALLQRCYLTMTTDSLSTILPSAQLDVLLLAQRDLDATDAGWNQYAYRQERDFYVEEDRRRQRAAKALVQRAALAKAARLKARQDSVACNRAAGAGN